MPVTDHTPCHVEPPEFRDLSPETHQIIVKAMLGEYDADGPPELSESVKDEIRRWAKPTSEEISNGIKLQTRR